MDEMIREGSRVFEKDPEGSRKIEEVRGIEKIRESSREFGKVRESSRCSGPGGSGSPLSASLRNQVSRARPTRLPRG